MELSTVLKEINRLRNGITFPTCEMKLKESLELGLLVHTFHPSTWKGIWLLSEFKASLVYVTVYGLYGFQNL